MRHLATGRYRDPAEDLPGGDPHAMLQAMDREGIDVSIVFRTMASHLIAVDDLIPSCPPPCVAASTTGSVISVTRTGRG